MYAVIMLLDKNSSNYIKNIWKKLSFNHIDSSMVNIDKIEPHITLALYDDLDVEKFKPKFENFKKHYAPLEMYFDIIGSFPSTNTCFVKPTATLEMLKLHHDYYEAFEEFNEYASPYYLPNRWTPHCTLGIGLNKEHLSNILNYCINNFEPFKGTATQIQLFKF